MSNETKVTDGNAKQPVMSTKKLVTLAMLAAVAYVLVVLIRVPLVPAAPYLNYDPKDIILMLVGFIFGPVEALVVTLLVTLLETFTVSSTGVIGFAMNFLASAAFAVTGAAIYYKRKTMKSAIVGLIAGVIAMTVVMVLWNYLLTPIYTGYPRAAVAAMLPTVFLPFNLIKASINAALTMIVYKPLVKALRAAGLIPKREAVAVKGHLNIIALVVAAVVFVSLVVFVFIQFK